MSKFIRSVGKIFRKDDRKSVKLAFRAVRNDMQNMEEGHFALKQSADEWIRFLAEKNNELSQRVEALERLLSIEKTAVEDAELEFLRTI